MNQTTDKATRLQHLRQIIRARKGLIGCGRGFSIALHQCGRLLYAGTNRSGQRISEAWTGLRNACCEGDSVVALLHDGTVRSAGRSEAETAFAEHLTCVRRVDVSAGGMAALLSNGTVAVCGQNARVREEVAEWPAVTDVCGGATFLAGLTEEGRVVVAGGSRMLRFIAGTWRDVVGIFADGEDETLYAIHVSGRLVSTSSLPGNAYKWRNLVFMAASGHRLLGVTAGGELLSTGISSRKMSENGRYVAVAVSPTHCMALSWNGAVLSDGRNEFGQCNTEHFGKLFENFEEYGIRRREEEIAVETSEKAYQRRRTESLRFAGYLSCSSRITACLTSQGRVLTSGGFGATAAWSGIRSLACGNAHILALGRDGRVFADGNPVGGCCAVSDWQNVRAISAGSYHSIGLTDDGHVLFCGLNDKGQGDVTEWTGIRYLRTTDAYTVGVGYEGRVILSGMPPFDPAWVSDIPMRPVDVAVAPTHMVALYADGRVYSTAEADGTDTWQNIRAVAVGKGFTVGLCYGGTVRVAVTDRSDRATLPRGTAETVNHWRQVVFVTCGETSIVALTADGRVLTAGTLAPVRMTETDQMSTHAPTPAPVHAPVASTIDWEDIIAVACSPAHIIALNRDGQVFACGADSDGQCSATAHFSLFCDAKHRHWDRPDALDSFFSKA